MVAVPLTVSLGATTGSGWNADLDVAPIAAAIGQVDVTVERAAGVSDAWIRDAQSLVAVDGATRGLVRNAYNVIVQPATLADFILQGRTATVRYVAPDLFVDLVVPEIVPSIAWTTGAAIIDQAGGSSGTAPPADTDWADMCAAAINAGINHRLAGVDILSTGDYPEIAWAAVTAGVEAYKRREATFGLTGYVDLQGAAIRIARDYLEAIAPIVNRYATAGIA